MSGAGNRETGETGARVGRNALHLGIGQLGTTALAIVMAAALARYLGAQAYGVYFLILTMTTSAYVVVEWGQPLFVIAQAARNPARASELLGSALALRAALAAAAVLLLATLAWTLNYGAHTTWLLVLLVAATLPLSMAQAYGMTFRAHDEMGMDAIVSVSNKVILLSVAVPTLAFGAGIPGVILAQALAGVGALFLAVYLHRRLAAPRPRVVPSTAREMFAAGVPIVVMTAMSALQPYLEALFIAKLATPVAVGWFGAARNILGTLIAPANILGSAAFPRIARVALDHGALRRELRTTMRPLLLIGALAGTGSYLFGGVAVAIIYGAAFAPAATILKVFAPGLFLLFVDILLGSVVYATGHVKAFAVVLALKVALSAGLNILLIPILQARTGNGGIGIMLSVSLSEVLVLGAALLILRPGTLSKASVLDLARALAAAALTIGVFRLIPLLTPWLGIPLCIGTFLAASWALGLFGREDLEALRRLMLRSEPAAAPRA